MSASPRQKPLWTVAGAMLGGGAFALMAATSCGEPEVPETPVPDAGTTTTTTTTTTTPTPTVQTGPCDNVMSLALHTAIKAREKDELAYGMKPDGMLACAQVAEGTSAAARLMLQTGKCYTFIAESFPNVTEVEVQMKLDMGDTPPPILAQFGAMPMAVDQDQGPRATIGRKDGCYKWEFPLPAPVRVEVTARGGDGPVAVQAYSR
ncbi:MAG: hypothetical protein JRI23_30195 [Deltaproteobacteria bacterium]|jgi:hypothetical protein|nr:hypothetical protein [Deltaproteobacteria bacterium]MBW2536440.1 hypothetical protein [Deltaproteobacteria bacterium]